MANDTPRPDRSHTDRGLLAGHGDDPTLASYLSTAVYLLSFPLVVGSAYGGHLLGWYAYEAIVPVLAGLFVALFGALLLVMHVKTGGQ